MNLKWGTAVLAAVLAVAVPGAALPAATMTRPHNTYNLPARHIAAADHIKPTSVAVVGDSISAWDPPYMGDIAQSWVPTALTAPLHLEGGFAYPGYKIGEVLPNVSDVDADVLVIMVGTNDMYWGVPLESRFADLDMMVARINPELVLVSTVAPYNPIPGLSTEWNAQLAQYATDRGFVFVDPWAVVRDGEYYLPGADYGDGVHPSTATAATIGAVMHEYIIAALHAG